VPASVRRDRLIVDRPANPQLARTDGLVADVADGVAGGDRRAGGWAETCLLLRRTTGWSPAQYCGWLRRTLEELLAPA